MGAFPKWQFALAVGALALLATASQCSLTRPPFEGGIRVTAATTIIQAGIQISSTATSGVFDSGDLVTSYGGGTGTQDSFSGYTGPDGSDDHAAAITDAVWNVGALYEDTCGLIEAPNQYVEPGGEVINTVCRILT